MKRITAEKLADYQSQGYWKGLTLDQCRGFEDSGAWPGVTLQEYLQRAADNFPANEAIVYNDQRITYREYQQKVNNLAAGLLKMGIKAGDKVLIQLHNCPEFAYLQVALPLIGAIMQPMHLVYRALEVRKRLKLMEAKAYVIPPEMGGFDFTELAAQMKGEASDLEHILVVTETDDQAVPDGMTRVSNLTNDESNAAVLDDYLKNEYEADPNDIAVINFTSGTESDPKGFVHTHNTIVGFSRFFSEEVCNFQKGQEVFLSFSPMTHTFGWLITTFAMFPAAKIIMVQIFSPTQTLSLVDKEKITFMQGTPTHLSRFINHEKYKDHNVTSLKLYMTGGAAIPPNLVTQFKEEMPYCGMINGFGMGEDLIHTIVMQEDPIEVMLQTVGSPLKNGTELTIFDAKRNPLPDGEKGELGYRGPNMFLGYYKNPEKTDETRGDDGWFYTGDTGFIDEDGRLRLSGRKKEMINKGGSKIFPLTIENILCFHPKIETVAIIGVLDEDLGEKVCACVIPKAGETVTHEDVKTYMEEQGASKYEMPDITEVLPEFPMTPTGKIKKDLLPERISKN